MANVEVDEIRHVRLPQCVMKAYDHAETDFEIGDTTTKYKPVVYTWLHQLVGGRPKNEEAPKHDAKLTELKNLLLGELSGQQVLIWFEYKREGRAIETCLRDANIRVRRIIGAVPLRQRHVWQKRFARGGIQVLCLMRSCAKYGLDLSAASVDIEYTQTMSHDNWAQSRERMAHPDKREPLLHIAILAKNTIDTAIYRAVRRKNVTSNMVYVDVAADIARRKEQRAKKTKHHVA